MAIKAPNFQDLVERPWVQRAVGVAATTVFAAGVTAASTFGTVEIAPMLAAPTYGGPPPATASRAVDLTAWTPDFSVDDALAGRSKTGTRSRSTGTIRGGGTATSPTTAPAGETPRGTGGAVNSPPPPPRVGDPPASHTDDQGSYVAVSAGDALLAIGTDGVGVTAGDTTVGTPPPEPASDGLTVIVDPLPPIVIPIP